MSSLFLCVQAFKKGLSGFRDWLAGSRFRLCDLVGVAFYGVIIGFGIWHHEPWSDEALPWMIARDTDLPGFLGIILQNWDRHPGLFHTLLLPFAKFGFPYFAQTVLNGFFALAVAAIFMTKAPFPRFFRYLFLFSFYMLYEYSVITRPYMLAILLLFMIAAFYSKRSEKPLTYAALITLLLHSDYIVFGLAVGLIAAFLFEHRHQVEKSWRLWGALAIMVLNAVWVFGMGCFLPLSHQEHGQKLLFHMQNIIQPIANAFFPFSDQVVYSSLILPAALWGGVLVLILVFIAIRKNLSAILILGSALSYLFSVFSFLHRGDYRHHGFILLSVIFVLWITSEALEPERAGRGLRGWLSPRAVALALLSLFLALGLRNDLFVYQQEYFLPFSGAKDMALAIRRLEKEHGVFDKGYVIVANHKKSVALMPYLPGVKFWSPCERDYAPYYVNTKTTGACGELSLYDVILRTQQHFGDLSKVLFLFDRPIPVERDATYDYQKVYTAGAGAFGYMYETFYLYRALPRALRPSR
jgi:hypothetical protein